MFYFVGVQTSLENTALVDGENDIVFRHNIKLQTPKCDCEESESFKSLLYRVNGLEEEVNYLKTQCAQGCCGKGGASGKLCHALIGLSVYTDCNLLVASELITPN